MQPELDQTDRRGHHSGCVGLPFRECLEIARKMYPDDERLLQLDHGERNTDNLSPWPGVAASGEKMNHDEFMRRTLELAKIRRPDELFSQILARSI